MLKRLLLALALFATLGPAHAGEFTGPRRALLSAGCPAAVKVGGICPSAGCNFTTGTCYASGSGTLPVGAFVTTTRASSHLCQFTNGTWISVGNNVPCITNQGFLIEEARTNKCTNYNANPTDLTNVTKSGDAAATLTVVDDTAALLAAGLQNIATSGKVYKLDNSAGATTAQAIVSGSTGNANPFMLSAYLRGIGTANLHSGFAQGPDITLTSSYVRSSYASVTTETTRVFWVRAQAGAVIYFTLNQLEEGSFVTSPIVTAGASATRAVDIPQLIGPALTATLAAKSAFFQTNGVEGFTTAIVYLGFSPAGSMYSPTTTSVGIYAGTGTDATAALGSGTTASTVKAAFGFSASGLSSRANGGTLATSATAWINSFTAVYLGNRAAGDRALNGYMQRFALSPVKGIFDQSTKLPYLLKRDVIPGTPANDNTPMYLNEAA